MAGLGALPSAGSILGNTPGASTQSGRKRSGQQGPYQPSVQPGTQQGASTQPQTFAQMQQQGMARPAPAQAMQQRMAPQQAMAPQQQPQQSAPASSPNINSQLQQSVSQALSTPSRYDLPQVQQVRDALTSQLQQQFGAQKKQLDEQLASRGLSASTIGGGYYGDLQGQQDTALANMNAQLIQNQAATSAGDLAASLGAGQNYQNAQNQNAVNVAGLTGNYNGQSTLGSQALGLQAQQQAQNYALGQGQLGVAQQQADTAQTGTLGNLGLQAGSLTGNYNGQQTLGSQAQQLAQQLGLGNLGVAQQQANTQQAGTLGQLGLGQQQLAQQGSQFGQTLAQQQLENQQQYGLAQGNLTGTYGGQQTLGAQQAAAQNALAQGQLTGVYQNNPTSQAQQFQQQLAQALQVAQMSDKTQNREVDANAALSQNDLMLKVASLLASMGYPNAGGSTGTTSNPSNPNQNPSTGGGSTNPSGGGQITSPGSLTNIQPSSGLSMPSYSLSPYGSANTSPSVGSTGTITTPTTGASTNFSPTGNRNPLDPGTTTGSQSLTAPLNYQMPMFGNGGYSGLFGNSPYTGLFGPSTLQYAGGSASGGSAGGSGGGSAPLGGGGGTPPGASLQDQVQSALGPPGVGPNAPQQGETTQDTFNRNTSQSTGGVGALAGGGVSSTGTDPFSLFAQGKIGYSQLASMVDQHTLAPGGVEGLTDDQITPRIMNEFQNVLKVNANAQDPYASAVQAFTNSANGTKDPRVMALFNTMKSNGTLQNAVTQYLNSIR